MKDLLNNILGWFHSRSRFTKKALSLAAFLASFDICLLTSSPIVLVLFMASGIWSLFQFENQIKKEALEDLEEELGTTLEDLKFHVENGF